MLREWNEHVFLGFWLTIFDTTLKYIYIKQGLTWKTNKKNTSVLKRNGAPGYRALVGRD